MALNPSGSVEWKHAHASPSTSPAARPFWPLSGNRRHGVGKRRSTLPLPSEPSSPDSPPTHPGVILFFLVLSPFLTYWLRQNGVYYFIVITACILLGTVMGFYVYKWTPSWAQHCPAVAMIATSIYAGKQKYYFEE